MNAWRFSVYGLLLCLAVVLSAADSVVPPTPPLPISPVVTFRRLLAMTAAERELELAARPVKQREILRARLAEYELLAPGRREERLRTTDLYWHLQRLLVLPAAERAPLLAAAPADLRPVLSQRLALWDQLPATDRESLLQHERTIGYLSRLQGPPLPPLPVTNSPVRYVVSDRMQAELAVLEKLSPAERRRLNEQWRQFFDAPPRAAAALRVMDEDERGRMEEVLRRFGNLPAAKRQACIESIARFASMTPSDRAAFLQLAEKWEALTPEERATWRRLVTKLPPLPPVPAEKLDPINHASVER